MRVGGLSHLVLEQVAVVCGVVAYLTGIVTLRPSPKPFDDPLPDAKLARGPHTLVDKTVVVVIDALRADHLVSSGAPLMPHLHALLHQANAHGFVLRTATPTVTLPRIKSLVTGTIPGFMDVVDNFGAGELTDDNLVQRWVDAGRRIHFYGDDTWLKLFPTQFVKKEGVTSFFVADYMEVDHNVSRHIPATLAAADDWDVLILHYLGLDHIGHLQGPMSPLVGPKLKEMDAVIRDLHLALQKMDKGWVLVVCGDHGMSDAGGHGGSSHAEVTTSALITSNLFAKKKLNSKVREANQVDLAPTLAFLTGVGVPVGGVGRPLGELFAFLPLEERMTLHHEAARQLLALARGSTEYATHDNAELLFEEASRLHQEVLGRLGRGEPGVVEGERVVRFYQECQEVVARGLSSRLQSYDLTTIFAATTAVVLTLTVCLWRLYTYPPEPRDVTRPMVCWGSGLTLLLWLLCCAAASTSCVCRVLHPTAWLLAAPFVYVFVVAGAVLAGRPPARKRPRCDPLYYLTVSGSVFHTLSLLGTSLVEEEHQTVYFLSNTFHVAAVVVLLQYVRKNNAKLSNKEDGKEVSGPCEDNELPTTVPSNPRGCLDTLRRTPVKLIIFLALSLALNRLLRTWNSTGDKWKHLEDLGDGIRAAGGAVLGGVVVLGAGVVFLLHVKTCGPLVFLACSCIIGRHYPLLSSTGVFEAQFTHLIVFIIFCYGLLKAKLIDFKTPNSKSTNTIYEPEEEKMSLMLKYSLTSFSLLCALLQRPDNLLLLGLTLLQNWVMCSVLGKLSESGILSPTTSALAANWLAFSHFFFQGNSNSLSTVDMGAGFVGVTNYRPALHAFLIAAHTFGPAFLTYLTYLIQVVAREGMSERWQYPLYVWWGVRLATLSLYLINVTLQRHHLFIWSVFTPKLLYEAAHLLTLCCLTLFMWAVERVCTVLEVSFRFE